MVVRGDLELTSSHRHIKSTASDEPCPSEIYLKIKGTVLPNKREKDYSGSVREMETWLGLKPHPWHSDT